MPKDYISREDAISCVKHAWAKGLEPTQYLEELDAVDIACVNFEDKDCDGEQLCACLGIVREKLKKLKEYEYTGLSPEEIKLKLDGLDEYRKAEAEGRLILLPCKVGDEVCFILEDLDESYVAEPTRITEVGSKGFWTSSLPRAEPGAMDDFTPWTEIGKTVFLTREEAEKALERSKNNGKH